MSERVLALALIGAAIIFAACGGGRGLDPKTHVERTAPRVGAWTIEEARDFKEFTVYWVGEEFGGLALNTVYRLSTPEVLYPQNAVIFIYGTCKPAGGLADGGCEPPLQIHSEPCSYGRPDGEPLEVRGNADARRDVEGDIGLRTGDVVLRLFGQDDLVASAAEALVSLNGLGPTSASEPLPPVSSDCSPEGGRVSTRARAGASVPARP